MTLKDFMKKEAQFLGKIQNEARRIAKNLVHFHP
jgi:hypothetical protein